MNGSRFESADTALQRTNRAQVGIGTLVVFIAMVLIAGIAGGVLIETAGLLQSKSQETGQEAQRGVTGRVRVVGAVGSVSQNRCYGSGGILIEGIGVEGTDCLQLDSGDSSRLWGDIDGNTLVFAGESTAPLSHDDRISFTRVPRDDKKDQIRVRDETRDQVIVTATPSIPIDESGAEDNPINFANPDGVGFVGVWSKADKTEEVRFARPNGTVGTIELTLMLAPGSPPLNLRDATVTYQSDAELAELTYTPDRPTDDWFSVSTNGDDVVLEPGERAEIQVNAWRIEGGLETGDTATIGVISSSGAVTRTDLRVPPTGNREAVRLFG